ncbi:MULTISPECIES: polymorphic toxin-type HINT domain-containing protein [unclassified Micromonospora]|uniref:polymorphic toxin-type HINT domain-containing protein n=1 Tax=unclassified Micromonospora TaxID=2617518 RepID=UPI00332F7F3F
MRRIQVADVANGIWYLAEGNYVDAGLSMSSAIPLAGYGASAVKFGKTSKKIYDGATATADTAKNVDNATDTAKAATPPPTAAKTEQPSTSTKKPDECNSFVPGTRVLLADGTSKRIEDVKVGDRVLAADVESGEKQSRPVTHLIKGDGIKKLVTIVIDADGKSGSKSNTIVATDGHRFWLPDAGIWVTADQLKVGAWLQTSAGTWPRSPPSSMTPASSKYTTSPSTGSTPTTSSPAKPPYSPTTNPARSTARLPIR